jgi:hypothetical protein
MILNETYYTKDSEYINYGVATGVWLNKTLKDCGLPLNQEWDNTIMYCKTVAPSHRLFTVTDFNYIYNSTLNSVIVQNMTKSKDITPVNISLVYNPTPGSNNIVWTPADIMPATCEGVKNVVSADFTDLYIQIQGVSTIDISTGAENYNGGTFKDFYAEYLKNPSTTQRIYAFTYRIYSKKMGKT